MSPASYSHVHQYIIHCVHTTCLSPVGPSWHGYKCRCELHCAMPSNANSAWFPNHAGMVRYCCAQFVTRVRMEWAEKNCNTLCMWSNVGSMMANWQGCAVMSRTEASYPKQRYLIALPTVAAAACCFCTSTRTCTVKRHLQLLSAACSISNTAVEKLLLQHSYSL